jgi:hypothetical protein
MRKLMQEGDSRLPAVRLISTFPNPHFPDFTAQITLLPIAYQTTPPRREHIFDLMT